MRAHFFSSELSKLPLSSESCTLLESHSHGYVTVPIHVYRAGSNSTPAHHYSDFRFKTYAPIAFRHFRDLFHIRPDNFLVCASLTPESRLCMKILKMVNVPIFVVTALCRCPCVTSR